MLGDASSSVYMQYLREEVLTTESDDPKLNQTSFMKVINLIIYLSIFFLKQLILILIFRMSQSIQR